MDYGQRRVTLAGRPVELSALEYGLLAELSASGRRPPSYQHLRPMRTIVGKPPASWAKPPTTPLIPLPSLGRGTG